MDTVEVRRGEKYDTYYYNPHKHTGDIEIGKGFIRLSEKIFPTANIAYVTTPELMLFDANRQRKNKYQRKKYEYYQSQKWKLKAIGVLVAISVGLFFYEALIGIGAAILTGLIWYFTRPKKFENFKENEVSSAYRIQVATTSQHAHYFSANNLPFVNVVLDKILDAIQRPVEVPTYMINLAEQIIVDQSTNVSNNYSFYLDDNNESYSENILKEISELKSDVEGLGGKLDELGLEDEVDALRELVTQLNRNDESESRKEDLKKSWDKFESMVGAAQTIEYVVEKVSTLGGVIGKVLAFL